MGVEFFFIVGGYYLLDIGNGEQKFKHYAKTRFIKLFPHFALSILLCAAVSDGYGLIDVVINVLGLQLVFLSHYINGELWFVVAQIPVCFLLKRLYEMLSKREIFSKVYFAAAGLISMFIIVLVYSKYNSFDVVQWHIYDFWPGAYMRAFYCTVFGILLSRISRIAIIRNWVQKNEGIVFVLSIFLTVFTCVLQFKFPHTRFELVCVLIWGMLIMITGMIKWSLNSVPLAKFTYPIYAYQAVILEEWTGLQGTYNPVLNGVLLLLTAIVLGILMDYIVKRMRIISAGC